jgi:hypothetical protein
MDIQAFKNSCLQDLNGKRGSPPEIPIRNPFGGGGGVTDLACHQWDADVTSELLLGLAKGRNEPVVRNLLEAKSRAYPMGVSGTATPLQGASRASKAGTGYRKHPGNVSNSKQGETPAKTSKRAKA